MGTEATVDDAVTVPATSSARASGGRRIREVVRRFRRECTAVRIPVLDRIRYWRSYIALARRGVNEYSPDRDAVYRDGPLKRRYDDACEKINRRLDQVRERPAAVEVPTFEHGELGTEDVRFLMRANIPFAIRDGARGLPLKDWTLDQLKVVAGDCPVPVNAAADRPSEDLSRPTKSHRYYEFHTGTLGEVIDSIRSGGNFRTTVAEDVMHHDGGRLRSDLGLSRFEEMSGWTRNRNHWLRSRLMIGRIVGAQLLLQPDTAFTLWHAEPGDNFFVLARGVKEWTLAHPYYTAAMRPRVKSTTNYHGSNIDIREPEDTLRRRGFAGYLNVPKVRIVLQPGDVLRVPNHWWHTVVTRPGDATIAVSIRSNSPPNLTGFGYGVLRLLDAQYYALAKAFATEGRIRDAHIGYPRPSRGADGGAAAAAGAEAAREEALPPPASTTSCDDRPGPRQREAGDESG